jgi:hypothetical protein
MTESAEFNIRQYKRMLDVIDRFERRQINIAHLITDLESLILALKNVSDDWRNKLLKEWATLEQIYAVALYREKKTLDQQEELDVTNSLSGLKDLVKRGIGH